MQPSHKMLHLGSGELSVFRTAADISQGEWQQQFRQQQSSAASAEPSVSAESNGIPPVK